MKLIIQGYHISREDAIEYKSFLVLKAVLFKPPVWFFQASSTVHHGGEL